MKIVIAGTVGVPGSYGGFETLAENLVRFHAAHNLPCDLTVYCSAKAYRERPKTFLRAELRYVPLDANNVQSIFYDIWSLVDSARRGTDVILLLGVSGAFALPLIRLISRARIITNVDGVEWKRGKWGGLARYILRWCEYAAVRWSHAVVADNEAIADHLQESYAASSVVIAYGGDHALAASPMPNGEFGLTEGYALALCRIEPENNVAMMLEAFAQMPDQKLVFVGNWNNSDYGRRLRARYQHVASIHLCDPVYDPARLRRIRDDARFYIHGHSAGGTNPALVEMMHFGIPVIAYDCNFNRFTTENAAVYFATSADLIAAVRKLSVEDADSMGRRMAEIAEARYTWDRIGEAYFRLIGDL